ncbi:PA14 domain-containing protein [Leptodesmis sp.]|uniref:PA14 domain-containing protein n=1 Tax=Leptodesmis sp. TaxID=3100501 RepID=UPI0040535AA4
MDLITQTAITTSSTLVNGLQADYYEGRNFNILRQTKLNPTVNFLWQAGAPSSSLPSDNFSVRWTGQVQPKYSETYTFYTNSDDGIKLWVNGIPLIDNWLPHEATENSGTITLNAGQLYTIQLEYYDLVGDAVAQLMWSSPSQTKEIIPQSQLFPSSILSANSVLETAKPAASFIDSIGINTLSVTMTRLTATTL